MENRAGKLATVAASVVLTGVSAVLQSTPAKAQAAPVFAVRAPAPAPLPVIALPVWRSAPSPLPFAGDGFSDDSMESLAATEAVPPHRPIDDQASFDAPDPAPRKSFSALTSFDESMELTSGDRQASNTARTFPPRPAQWNNPIQWLSTHHQ